MKSFLWLALILQSWTITNAAKILLAIVNHKSHLMYCGHLAKALAADGNDVTALVGSGMKIMPEFQTADITWMTYKMSNPPATYSDQQVDAILEAYLGNGSMIDVMKTMTHFFEVMTNETMELFDDKDALEKLSKSKFDFVVIDASVLGYAYLPYWLGVQFATLSIDVDPMMARMPLFSSYVPPLISSFSDHMTFMQRTISFIAYYVGTPVIRLLVPDNGIAHGPRCAPDKPPKPYLEQIQQASLFLTLRLPILHFIRGSSPNVFDIGGIMGRPANLANISPELNAFINKSPKGVIMVSFGSWLDKLPAGILNKFLEAFAAVEYNVIWKITKPPESRPDNVLFTSWMPQNDLLGHPKVKAFITHCGISSSIETIYHGAPIIGFPMGLDQTPNARLMEHRQFGIIMDITTFSPFDVILAIRNVTEEGSVYRDSIRRASAILKDMPDAGKTVSFWIKHVVQHGRDHLRSAAFDLTWYQYLSLDVIAFLLLTTIVSLKLLCVCCKKSCGFLSRKCCRKGAKEKNE